jgi:sulfur carrier protein
MKIVVNGAERDSEAANVGALLETLRVDPSTIVVEHNGALLRRDQLDVCVLQEGDRLELVRFVGGG